MKTEKMNCRVYASDELVVVCCGGKRIDFYKNSSKAQTSSSDALPLGSFELCQCYGILGAIEFCSGPYLIVVTDAKQVGRLFQKHSVYAIFNKQLIPLFSPYTVTPQEAEYISWFDQFDPNGLFFSDTYNLTRSLQQNDGDARLAVSSRKTLKFDEAYHRDKYRYNWQHVQTLKTLYGNEAANCCLRVIYGFYGQANVCLSGRNLKLAIVARRSRFYAGTRYLKRGITASGHVANDVETEQILLDPDMTTSCMSFVQIRGSTPVYWSQDTSVSLLTKPPITYPQVDVGYSAMRNHVKDLMFLYGCPLIFLNLLNSVPGTDEGDLCSKYHEATQAINSQLPASIQIKYSSRNIREALQRGGVRRMLEQVLSETLEIGMFHKLGNETKSVQTGVLRSSCLDCLDRTSAVTVNVGCFVLLQQLQRLGIKSVEEPCFTLFSKDALDTANEPSEKVDQQDPLLQAAREMYQQMGDDLAMQYAGSRALRKYQGLEGALQRSLAIFTQIQRRYHSHFADAERQARSNVFLGLVKPKLQVVDNILECDAYLHHEKLQLQTDIADWWVLPLMCHVKKHWINSKMTPPLWIETMYNEQGEYIPWINSLLKINAISTKAATTTTTSTPDENSYAVKKTFEDEQENNYVSLAVETRLHGRLVRAMQLGFHDDDKNVTTIQASVNAKHTCEFKPLETKEPSIVALQRHLQPSDIVANVQALHVAATSTSSLKSLKEFLITKLEDAPTTLVKLRSRT